LIVVNAHIAKEQEPVIEEKLLKCVSRLTAQQRRQIARDLGPDIGVQICNLERHGETSRIAKPWEI